MVQDPMVYLHAPESLRGGGIRLGADVRVGTSLIQLKADLSPDTIRWIRSRWDGGKRQLARYVGNVGHLRSRRDWDAFGSLGAFALRNAHHLARHLARGRTPDTDQAVRMYDAARGGVGPAAQDDAMRRFEAIVRGIEADEPAAYEAYGLLTDVSTADRLLSEDNACSTLRELDALACSGEPHAQRLLAICRSLGAIYSSEPIWEAYDAEQVLSRPTSVDDLAQYAANVLTFRAMQPTAGLEDVQDVIDHILLTLPAITVPYEGAYPYYGAGYDNASFGSKRGAGWHNPDEIDYRRSL